MPATTYPAIGRWSSEDVTAIVARLFEGESMSRVAKDYGVAHSSISRLCSALGITDALTRHLSTANARMAAELFNKTRRLLTLAKIADHVDAALDQAELGSIPAKDMRDIAVTTGVLIDKQRLEDGESTNNQSVQVRVWGRRELPASGNTTS